MAAKITYTVDKKGNTVPYPPLFDSIRQNHGFMDTRGRPELVAAIPEVRDSLALTSLLMTLAAPSSPLSSVGCDLGQSESRNSRFETRRAAGGYVQIIVTQRYEREKELSYLQKVAKSVQQKLVDSGGTDRWEINLCLAPTVLKFEGEAESQSIWIWFNSKASTYDRARASRERLLNVIRDAILDLPLR